MRVSLLLTLLASAAAGIDPRSFGAACDGQTDDAPALQQAIAALAPGGTLEIPCMLAVGALGVRLVGETGVIVTGTGPESGIRSLAPTGQRTLAFGPVTFLVVDCTDCQVSNLTFDGNNAGVLPLGVSRSRNTAIRNNRFVNVGLATGGAVSADGNTGNEYSGNRVESTAAGGDDGTRGMWLGNPTERDLERSPLIFNNVVRNTGHTGIAVHGDNVIIAANTIEHAGGAGIKLVQFASAGAGSVKDNTLRGNRFHGLQLEYCRNLEVSGNLAEMNDLGGIYVLFGLENAEIQRNTLRDNNRSTRDGPIAGLWLAAASATTVRGNEIYDSGAAAGRTQANGIVVLATTPAAISNLTIANNTCRNHRLNGIHVIATAAGAVNGLTVTGNTCTGNGQAGFKVDEKVPGAVLALVDDGNIYVPKPATRPTPRPAAGKSR